ncbi:heterokaryon incompatibility protein-domain-containing protein [Lophiotrema nucula]|uniref:Heterokaryon incompatibility protein-domain-containing protein n=1 Tax=Lophiotrema nucula TaxID=690887 RepID=A0A6A5Z5S5_9PLEO|nr:heterokaryon incompatibility protein-domain-containing protein [Lophiotrema nucula]
MTASAEDLAAWVPQQPHDLCERCARINLESLFPIAHPGYRRCPHAWPSSTPKLSTGSRRPPESKADYLRIIEEFVDFDVLRGWVSFCHEHHEHEHDHSHRKQTVRAARDAVQSIRFIDCATRQVVSAPDTDDAYAALSYVWGQGYTNVDFSTALSDVLPDTIEDAIETTSRLGIKYLWIDRYCIDQNDASDKKFQISRMDVIYNRAYVTIVAAAGTNPDYGLPGVRHRSRDAQKYLRIGRYFVFNKIPDAIEEGIKFSKWARRGWTYQESVLSTRRLIFTDDQVYFECPCMYCYESVNSNGRDISSMNFIPHIEGRIPMFESPVVWEVFTRVEDYSQRELSWASDILKGILGVLRNFELGPLQIRHILGVPLFPFNADGRPASLDSMRMQSGNTQSGRYDVAAFCLGLCWRSRRPYHRREGFPSWSWTGWFGPADWRTIQWYHDGVDQGDPSILVRVRLLDKRIIEWADFFESYFQLAPQLSGELLISAWVLDIHFPESEQWDPDTYYESEQWDPDTYYDEVLVSFDGRKKVLWTFDRTSKARHTMRPCIAVRLAYSTSSDPEVCVMVAQEVEGGSFERIGYIVTKDFPIPRQTNGDAVSHVEAW